MKRIPRIKFPQRHPKPSGSSSHTQEASTNEDLVQKHFSRPSSMSTGGRASDQPMRTPVSQEEIEALTLGGCL